MIDFNTDVMTFRIVKVDAVLYDDQWVYNDTSYVGEFTVSPETNIQRKFRNELNKRGIKLLPGYMRVVDYSDTLEAHVVKTGRPMYAAILM